MTEGVSVPWGHLHVGDVVQGRDGRLWRVDLRERTPGTRWLAGAGTGRADLFRLSTIDGSRPPVTATRVLSDAALRVFEFDRTAERAALTALSAQFETTMISEGEATPMDTATPRADATSCPHPVHELSTLKDGRVWCTACFTTLSSPGDGEPVTVAELRTELVGYGPVEQPSEVLAVDGGGIEYRIPADQVAAACAAGIHPVASRQFVGEEIAGCSSCGLVYPAPAESPAASPAAPAEPVAPAPAVVPAATTSPRSEPAPDLFADPAGFVEVKRDRWGRYVLPHPVTGVEQPWVRASTLARCLADEYHLNGWKMRQTARGIALNPDLIAGAVAADPEDKGTLDNLVTKAMERAESSSGANLGTALHSFSVRLDRGESLASLRAPKPLDADLAEYLSALKRFGLNVLPDLMERIVVCPDLGAAGTFDRIVQQHTGYASSCPLSVLDLKTGKSVEHGFLEFAIQQAIYNHATHMWDPVKRDWLPLPPANVLDRDRALILHLPVGKAHADLYAVNTIEGWEAAQVAEQVRQYRNAGKGYGWLVTPTDQQSLLIHRVSIADGNELARLWDKHYPLGEWTPEVANAAAERVARLQAVPA